MRAESASRMHRQKVRNWKKRQKVYSGVKKQSGTRQKAAESLHENKGKVGYARKNGKNFTSARTEGASRSAEPEETAETAQRSKETVAKERNSGRNCAAM